MNNCNYCNGNRKDILKDIHTYKLIITYTNEIMIEYKTDNGRMAMFSKINNCPMCGRKLIGGNYGQN